MKNTPSIPRRSFVKYSLAAAAAPMIVPRHVLGGPTAPSNRITLGGVGVGGVGHGQVKGLAKAGFQVEALCDVDDLHAAKTYKKFPKARRYRDFREMLAKEGDKIDAVYCGTPDHTHAFVTLAALRAKKHVCCVKPLTRSMEECYLVVEEAKKAGVATQVTATPCTSEYACRVCEIIASGILALYALRCASNGMKLDELARHLAKKRNEIGLVAMVDTLEYLRKGGRISGAAAFAGGVLNIKPVVTCRDGELTVLGKARGSKKANNLLVEQISKDGVDFSMPLLLGYTGLSDEMLQQYILDSQSLWKGHVSDLDCVRLSSVIGTHAGPGAVAVAYFKSGAVK